MANPVKVNIPADTWTLVAENVDTGLINIKQWQPARYWQTYVANGDPAPTGSYDIDEATESFSNELEISSSAPIDVYLYCRDTAGAVVANL